MKKKMWGRTIRERKKKSRCIKIEARKQIINKKERKTNYNDLISVLKQTKNNRKKKWEKCFDLYQKQ